MSSPRKSQDSSLVLRVDCPQRRIHYIINGKWTSMVIYALSHSSMRTGRLERALPGISKKMLIQTLRDLEGGGLIERRVLNVVPPHVEYSLTPLGETFVKPLRGLYDWAAINTDALDELEDNLRKAKSSG